ADSDRAEIATTLAGGWRSRSVVGHRPGGKPDSSDAVGKDRRDGPRPVETRRRPPVQPSADSDFAGEIQEDRISPARCFRAQEERLADVACAAFWPKRA